MLTVSRRRPSWSLAWVSTPTVTRVGWACAMVVMAISLRAWGGWHAPAGWADSTAMSLWAQASIRSGLLGWRCKAGGRGVEPTDQVKGTKPVDRWGQALTAATRQIIAVDPWPHRAGHRAADRGALPPRARVAAAAPTRLEPAAARPPGGRA